MMMGWRSQLSNNKNFRWKRRRNFSMHETLGPMSGFPGRKQWKIVPSMVRQEYCTLPHSTSAATFPSDSIEQEWLNSENAKFHPSLLFQRRKAKKTRNLLQHPNLNHRKRITTQLKFPMSVIPLPLMDLAVKLRQTKARKQPSRKL